MTSSARPAVNGVGHLAYGVFQQGNGLIDVFGAVESTATDCANVGLDIVKELNDVEHYGGPAWREGDEFFVFTEDKQASYTWDGSYDALNGYAWIVGFPWLENSLPVRPWHGDYPWIEEFPPLDQQGCLAEGMSINQWVEQE